MKVKIMTNEELIKKAKTTTKDLSGNGLLNEKQSNMFINFAILLAIKNQYLFRNVEKKMTKLWLLNFILLQWFCMRLTRVMEFDDPFNEGEYVQIGWTVIYVLPLTGWWSKYIYIWKRK